jgi:hypothetical protein
VHHTRLLALYSWRNILATKLTPEYKKTIRKFGIRVRGVEPRLAAIIIIFFGHGKDSSCAPCTTPDCLLYIFGIIY